MILKWLYCAILRAKNTNKINISSIGDNAYENDQTGKIR